MSPDILTKTERRFTFVLASPYKLRNDIQNIFPPNSLAEENSEPIKILTSIDHSFVVLEVDIHSTMTRITRDRGIKNPTVHQAAQELTKVRDFCILDYGNPYIEADIDKNLARSILIKLGFVQDSAELGDIYEKLKKINQESIKNKGNEFIPEVWEKKNLGSKLSGYEGYHASVKFNKKGDITNIKIFMNPEAIVESFPE
jgi:hypothetical protein